MIVSGILLKANKARIVTLAGTKENHSVIAPKFHELSLPKNPTQEDVEVFTHAIKAYCSDHSIDKIVVNRRNTSGKGAGGAGTFIVEGILLAVCPAVVEFIHPATIRAVNKREDEQDEKQKVNKPSTIDLGKAYDHAFEGLS